MKKSEIPDIGIWPVGKILALNAERIPDYFQYRYQDENAEDQQTKETDE